MYRDELKDVLAEMAPPNIVVIGKTGAGKSSLINAVFGKELAKTGTGLAVSDAFIRYPKSNESDTCVVVYDSAGYEMGKDDKFKLDVFEFFEEKKKGDIRNQIHLVWYVILAPGKRIESFDLQILKRLREDCIPVLVVLSQCDGGVRDSDIYQLKETIKAFATNENITPFEILTCAAFPIKQEPYGISDVVDKSVSLLPELYTTAFVTRQIENLPIKRKYCIEHIKRAAIRCFASGFIPVPLSTTAALVDSQSRLLKNIAAIYGYSEWADDFKKESLFSFSAITSLVVISLGDLGVTGSMWSGFLPGIVFGGATGAVAATYSTVIGATLISVFEILSKRGLEGLNNKEEINEFLKETYKEEFKRFSNLKIKSKEDVDNLQEIVNKAIESLKSS